MYRLQGVDLSSLSLEALEGMEAAVESFTFKQQLKGEKFHPDYKKNRKLFKKLINTTDTFRRNMARYFKEQFERITPRINAPGIRADDSPNYEDDYFKYIDWDEEEKKLRVVLEVDFGSLFAIGAKATELELQTDLNVGPHLTEESKFLRRYTVELSGQITETTRKRITTQIRTAIETGQTRQELVNRIDNVLNNPVRARTIAQTESIRAYAEGKMAVARKLNIPYKQLLAFQVDPNEVCGQVKDEIVPLEDSFRNGLTMPPFHPNCKCSLRLLNTNSNEPNQPDIADVSGDPSIFDSAR